MPHDFPGKRRPGFEPDTRRASVPSYWSVTVESLPYPGSPIPRIELAWRQSVSIESHSLQSHSRRRIPGLRARTDYRPPRLWKSGQFAKDLTSAFRPQGDNQGTGSAGRIGCHPLAERVEGDDNAVLCPMDKLGDGLRQNTLVRIIERFSEEHADSHLKDLVIDECGPGREIVVLGRRVINFGLG